MTLILPEKIEILNIGSAGIVSDRPGHLLPGGAWTSGQNFRFHNDTARRSEGRGQIFGAPGTIPYQIFNVPGLNGESFWIYFSLTKAFVVDSGSHSDITRTVGGNYTAAQGRDWDLTLLAGVPIITNFADVPQYWPALASGTALAALPNWNANKRAKRIVAFGSYLFALNLIETGVSRPHKILVSHKADTGSVPNSWDPTDATKDATEFELTDADGGEILDAVPLGDMLMVYKVNSTHVIRFQGGNELWKRDRVFENKGILAQRCACSFKDGTMHFVATQTDIIMHSGTPGSSVSVVEGTNRDKIFKSLDPVNYLNSFVFEHPSKPEVWFCYVETGNTFPNMACIYNYIEKTTAFEEWQGLGVDFGVVINTTPGDWD